MKLRIVVGALLLVFCVAAGAADRKYIVKPRASDMKALPFSDGVLVGNTLYIAGHIGLAAPTGLPPASAEDEARLVMAGIKQTVALAGLTMDEGGARQGGGTDRKGDDAGNGVDKTEGHGEEPARAGVGAAN